MAANEQGAREKIEKNLDALLKKHTLSVRVGMDGKDVLDAEIKQGTILLDSRNTLKILMTPELVKLGLALRGAYGGKYRVRMKQSMLKRILGKE